MNRPDGIVFFDKPEGETSFRALSHIKRALGTRKVGHTGTLDKFASGLLVVLTGRFTRLNSIVTAMDKCYEATFSFGTETETLDPEGAIVAQGPLPSFDQIKEVLPQFIGKIKQTPPLYSAIHIDGKRAHERVRSGETDIQIPQRDIEIFSFDLLSYSDGLLRVKVHCSKGTYIRSLARDLALASGSRAHVTELKRLAVGPFKLEEAFGPETFLGKDQFIDWESFFLRLPYTGCFTVEDEVLSLMANGVPFKQNFIKEQERDLFKETQAQLLALKSSQNELKAILEKKGPGYVYKINFSS